MDLQSIIRACGATQSLTWDPLTLPSDKFWFKNKSGEVVPYKVLQVNVFLDVVSNCVKHGTGVVHVARTPSELRVSNPIGGTTEQPPTIEAKEELAAAKGTTTSSPASSKRNSRRRSSTKTGLRALKAECDALGIGISFAETADRRFVTTIQVTTEPAVVHLGDRERQRRHASQDDADGHGRRTAKTTPDDDDDDDLRLLSSRQQTAQPAMDPGNVPGQDAQSSSSKQQQTASRRPRVEDLAWILIEDQPTICALWAQQMRQKYGVELQVLCTPPEVARADVAVGYAAVSIGGTHKRVVCVMDEHLLELTDDLDVRPCTGTVLRDRFFAKPKLARAIADGRVHLVGASSNEIADPRLHSVVGKHGSTRKMVEAILDDIARRPTMPLD